MIRVNSKGDFSKTKEFFNKLRRGDAYSELARYGQIGVDALARSTPVESGLTANSWYYKVFTDIDRPRIEWHNTNIVSGVPVVILLQYGHGTGTGGYVSGRDFINPVMQSIFDQIADDVWKKVIS